MHFAVLDKKKKKKFTRIPKKRPNLMRYPRRERMSQPITQKYSIPIPIIVLHCPPTKDIEMELDRLAIDIL